jgi:hypothetical protein
VEKHRSDKLRAAARAQREYPRPALLFFGVEFALIEPSQPGQPDS